MSVTSRYPLLPPARRITGGLLALLLALALGSTSGADDVAPPPALDAPLILRLHPGPGARIRRPLRRALARVMQMASRPLPDPFSSFLLYAAGARRENLDADFSAIELGLAPSPSGMRATLRWVARPGSRMAAILAAQGGAPHRIVPHLPAGPVALLSERTGLRALRPRLFGIFRGWLASRRGHDPSPFLGVLDRLLDVYTGEAVFALYPAGGGPPRLPRGGLRFTGLVVRGYRDRDEYLAYLQRFWANLLSPQTRAQLRRGGITLGSIRKLDGGHSELPVRIGRLASPVLWPLAALLGRAVTMRWTVTPGAFVLAIGADPGRLVTATAHNLARRQFVLSSTLAFRHAERFAPPAPHLFGYVAAASGKRAWGVLGGQAVRGAYFLSVTVPFSGPPGKVTIPPLDLARIRARMKDLEQGKVLTSLVPLKGSRTGLARAVGIVRASPESVWKVMNDFEGIPKRTPTVQMSKVESRRGNEVELRQVTNLGFMKIDYTVRLRIDRPNWRMTFDLVRGNVRSCTGSWQIQPLGATRTLAAYSVAIDPGLPLPQQMVDNLVKGMLPSVIHSLRKGVARQGR